MASTKGSAPSATTPEPARPTVSSHGMTRSAAGASAARTRAAVPHPTSVRPGRSKRTVGLPSNSQRVGPVLERDAPGVERLAHREPVRVATTCWLRPPANGRIPTAEKPASISIRRRTGGGGEVGHRAGEVVVCLLVGERPAQSRDGPVEPHVVPGAPEPGRRGVDFEHGEPAAGAEHPGTLRERGREVGEVAECVAAHETVEGAVDKGEATAIGLDERRGRAVGRQHARAQVRPDHAVAAPSCQPGEVPRPAGQVEHERVLGQGERPHGAPPPGLVEPEGHQAVHQVVARCDGVEHGAHACRLLVAGGQWRGRRGIGGRRADVGAPWCGVVSAVVAVDHLGDARGLRRVLDLHHEVVGDLHAAVGVLHACHGHPHAQVGAHGDR